MIIFEVFLLVLIYVSRVRYCVTDEQVTPIIVTFKL